MIEKERESFFVENWYEITEFSNGIVAIGEPRHQEEVYCYLIKGKDRDLLIDTGMGIVPITHALEVVRNSSKPLVVANTHWHFDHVGGNQYFEEVLVPNNFQEVSGLHRGWSHDDLQKYGFEAGFHTKEEADTTPPGFDSKNFFVPPRTNINPVLKEGVEIELGDRIIVAIETSGHTPGEITFYDRDFGLLFSGDLLYEGPLYAFEGESNPIDYLKSLKRLKKFEKKIKTIHPGHNYPENIYEPDLLNESIELLERAKSNVQPDGLGEFENTVEYKNQQISTRTREPRRLKLVVRLTNLQKEILYKK